MYSMKNILTLTKDLFLFYKIISIRKINFECLMTAKVTQKSK